MLDLVQGQIPAGDVGAHVAPRALHGDVALVDLPDRIHRIGVQDHLHGARVVEVDPVGHLLRPAVLAGVDSFQARDVSGQLGRVIGTGRQRGIVEDVDALRIGIEVAVQDVLPGAMVDGLDIGLVTGIPLRDPFRLRRRAGRDQNRRGQKAQRQVAPQPVACRRHSNFIFCHGCSSFGLWRRLDCLGRSTAVGPGHSRARTESVRTPDRAPTRAAQTAASRSPAGSARSHS